MGVRRVLLPVALVVGTGLATTGCDLPNRIGGGDPQPLDIDVEPIEFEEICIPVFDPDPMAMADGCDDGPSGSFSRG